MNTTPVPVAPSGAIPDATIARLPGYLRVLSQLAADGVATVSSNALADAAHVQPALLRRDLSYLGSYGTRGVGYETARLIDEIGAHVGSRTTWPVIIVGVGNLGRALARHDGLMRRGFELVGLVDHDPAVIGREVGGVRVTPDDQLERLLETARPTIGVITTPESVAQQVADRLVAGGVTSLLNFAPVNLAVPEGVRLRSVDVAQELQILAFHESHRSEPVQ